MRIVEMKLCEHQYSDGSYCETRVSVDSENYCAYHQELNDRCKHEWQNLRYRIKFDGNDIDLLRDIKCTICKTKDWEYLERINLKILNKPDILKAILKEMGVKNE